MLGIDALHGALTSTVQLTTILTPWQQ